MNDLVATNIALARMRVLQARALRDKAAAELNAIISRGQWGWSMEDLNNAYMRASRTVVQAEHALDALLAPPQNPRDQPCRTNDWRKR